MEVLDGLLPVFLLLVVGVSARQMGLVNAAAATGLNRLVANVALPALLVLKVGTSPLETSLSPVLMALTSLAAVVAAGGVLLAARVWKLPRRQQGVVAQAAMRGNVAYVAFPIILAAHGDVGLRLAAVTVAALIPTMSLLAVTVLEIARGERASVIGVLARVFANPLVLASLSGLLLASLGWRPWGWLGGTLQILADFALPGALLALGAQLRFAEWRGVWRPTLAATFVKLAVLPAGCLWVLRGLPLTPLEVAVGVLLMAAPTAIATYPVAADLGGDTDLAGACVVVTTIVAFPGYAAWMLLLAG